MMGPEMLVACLVLAVLIMALGRGRGGGPTEKH